MATAAIVLDTNAYSAYRRGTQSVLEAMARAEVVLLPVVVAAELLYGFRGGSRESENRAELRAFLAKPSVRFASGTEETAELFAETKVALRRASTPIPTNDVWVAAHCQEHGATLVTFDRHFLDVPGLRVWPELRTLGA